MANRSKLDLGLRPGAMLSGDDEGTPWMAWLALACTAIVFLLVYNAYPMLGMVLGTVLLTLIVLRLVLYVWLSTAPGEPETDRDAFVSRLDKLSKNRAIAKLKSLRSKR